MIEQHPPETPVEFWLAMAVVVVILGIAGLLSLLRRP